MDLLNQRVLVTGANGFVGRHLLVEAARRGVAVHGVVRRAGTVLPFGATPVVIPQLGAAAELDRACQGCTAVVHLAARVHVMHDEAPDSLAEFRRVNVGGTRAVLDAAARARANRFLYVSSVKVNGDGRLEPYRETDLPRPEDPYGVSKSEAEDLVRSYDRHIETVILRSPLLYGPGVRGNFRRLLGLAHVARRIPLPLGGLHNRRSLIYVGNLADAILHLLQSPEARGRTFLVSDGEDLSTSELVRRIGRAGGFAPRLIPLPEALLRFTAGLVGWSAEVRRLAGSLAVDAAALAATGWRPPYTVDEGLAETVRWWLSHRVSAEL